MTPALSIPTDTLSDAQALVLLDEVRRALTFAESLLQETCSAPIDRTAVRADLERLGLLKVFGTGATTFVVIDINGALMAWKTYAEQVSGGCL